VRSFTTTIQRGDKVGIIGPNGSGKTTLLRILMGRLPTAQGRVKLGTHVKMAYFDQLRAQLDENKSVLDNVGEGRDVVTIKGKNRSLIGYLGDFLFSPDRVHAPITALSGGERNRLLLARLFTLPANLLVLDEPTNDLDIDTLELLEDQLMEYSGTLLLVSHDRAFLNNLVTSIIVLDGSGNANEYVGGYDDWLRQRQVGVSEQPASRERALIKSIEKAGRPLPANAPDAPQSAPEAGRKLSYKEQRALEAEQRELTELPGRIEILEKEQQSLTAAMADPSFYQRDGAEIARDANRLKQLEEELTQAFLRWEELEGN
jgi:ABC transport system ATP-binding/permease protein